MSATFAAPVASTLLAVELLLFEWKPRSLIPVALAAVTADAVRYYIIGAGPLFPTPTHAAFIGIGGLLGCLLVGVLAGALRALLTVAVYAAEDAFRLLPIHWMWWPAIGGVVIGVGGLDLSTGARRRLRHHRRVASGQCASRRDPGHSDREVDYLVGLARLWHLWRRTRAVADDGRRARRLCWRLFCPMRVLDSGS